MWLLKWDAEKKKRLKPYDFNITSLALAIAAVSVFEKH